MSSTRPNLFDRSPQLAVEYPESDGLPMGETDFHYEVIAHLKEALILHFQKDPLVYVAANIMFYFEQGNPKARRSPDVFVARGVSKRKRRIYQLWNEAPPVVIFEINSRSTHGEDSGTKHALYQRLGVREYFQFDPLGEYLTPRLRGFRLIGSSYQALHPQADGSLRSVELGLILSPQEDMLRLVDPSTGGMLPTPGESSERADAEGERAEALAKRADAADERARAAEAEVARLRALLDERDAK